MGKMKAHIFAPEQADVGRRVVFTGGIVPEEGRLTGFVKDNPTVVMVSFGGCRPERCEVAALKWGRKG